jgi:hypothetical protein
MAATMFKSKKVGSVWHGMFRMRAHGKWHTVANTSGEPVVFRSADDAASSGREIGRMYRTGATQ